MSKFLSSFDDKFLQCVDGSAGFAGFWRSTVFTTHRGPGGAGQAALHQLALEVRNVHLLGGGQLIQKLVECLEVDGLGPAGTHPCNQFKHTSNLARKTFQH